MMYVSGMTVEWSPGRQGGFSQQKKSNNRQKVSWGPCLIEHSDSPRDLAHHVGLISRAPLTFELTSNRACSARARPKALLRQLPAAGKHGNQPNMLFVYL